MSAAVVWVDLRGVAGVVTADDLKISFAMNRIDRLFGILTLLQSRRYVPAEKIAERFDISVRTVYRDVKALCEQGVPVSFEAGRGYFVVQGYFLPPVSFSTEEANALLLSESVVAAFTDRSIQQHYATALHKVKAVMKTGDKQRLEELDNKIKMQLPACIDHSYEYLSGLQQAISDKMVVEICYRNLKDEECVRRVEPIGLIFYALNWHLIAWCHVRADYRDFRVSRIRSLRNCGIPFTRTDHVAVGDYMKGLPVDY